MFHTTLGPLPMIPSAPLKVVTKYHYLGIEVQRNLSCFITDNLLPLLYNFVRKCSTWASLPLSTIGQTNLIKMLFLPTFLNFFSQF